MKLLLTSQTIHNKSIENALRSLLPRPSSECDIVYITTSANNAFGDKTWFLRDLQSVHSMGWQNFWVVDFAAMSYFDKSTWWQQIEDADVLVVGGGTNFYLSYWFEQSGFAAELPRLLQNKVYVGSSAGSIIATHSLLGGTPALRQFAETGSVDFESHGPAGQRSSLAMQLVDIELRPHYGRADKDIPDEVLQQAATYSGRPLYALDDESVLAVVDGDIQLVSEGTWRKFEP